MFPGKYYRMSVVNCPTKSSWRNCLGLDSSEGKGKRLVTCIYNNIATFYEVVEIIYRKVCGEEFSFIGTI